jgi:hypothetical protein
MALEDATNPMRGVSGPGPFAKRTDLSYQSPAYGEGAAYNAAKSGAPLATAPKSPMLSQAPKVAGGAPAAGIGLYDPTQRPDEPITHGIPVGAGAGPEALMMNQSQDTPEEKARLLSYLPALEAAAQQPDSSQSFRNYVRVLRANLL